jgi:hypothetical protein
MADEYRIRAGTHSSANLPETYSIHRFPVQADQGNLRWFNPVDPSGNVKQFAEIVDASDGTRGGYGDVELSWFFGALTQGMVAYIKTTFFGNALYADVTIRTWDRSLGWRVLQCRALWNDPSEFEGAPGMNGYLGLRIDFIKGIPG